MESPENKLLYKPVTPDDPATIEMANSMRVNGVLEAIVVTADHYILSGHRRDCAARLAGLREVPVRVRTDVRRGHGKKASPEFLRLLREYNRQRIKSRDELLREELATIDPKEAHAALSEYRKSKSKIKLKPLDIVWSGGRDRISEAKKPFLEAIKRVITDLQDYLPLTLRQVHYTLLNHPPLIHAAKRDSRYCNNKRSYGRLTDLLTRARYEGLIDFEAIHDPTRPVTIWAVHRDVQTYYSSQTRSILRGYSRDLLQSQPHHIEMVVEKITLHSLIEPIASKFCMPLTIGRGQCSTRPLYDLVQRYNSSGKDKLLVLAVSDLDADGDAIALSILKRLRYDYQIENADVFKIALTMQQVRRLRLPESYERAKVKSKNYKRYRDTYRTNFVWELEAVPPATLQRLIEQAIDKVIDKDAFNDEVTQEAEDAAHIQAVRTIVVDALQEQTGN
jgi:hypothetical protein